MMASLFYLVFILTIATAQLSDRTYTKKDKNYGEETYISPGKISHFNTNLQAYHELVKTDDGIIFNWERKFDV